MTPSLRKLDMLVGIWIVTGPLLLVIGALFMFSAPGIVTVLAATASGIGAILLVAALVGKVATLALLSLDESRKQPHPDEVVP
ncbi:UNVERIFIED_CONTAM: hypothetical protein OHV15_05950 [Microbacterium sp. SLM126]